MTPHVPTRVRRFPWSLAFAASAAFVSVCEAQQPAPPPPSPASEAPKPAEKSETIEVQADALSERRESTAAKIIVNRDEILKYGDSNILDVMKRLPGITVGGAGGRGNEIRMRGLGSGYTQILVDGERMPPGFTLDSISPDLIERIEIIRGATAEFSTQAVAGTINVVLRRAATQQKREVKATLTAEEGRVFGNLFVQLADKAGDLSWSIPISANRYEYANTASTDQRGFDPLGRPTLHYRHAGEAQGHGANLNIGPRLNWALGKGHTFSWDMSLLAGENFNGFHGVSTPFFGEPPPYLESESRNQGHVVVARANAAWTRRFDDGTRAEVKLGVNFHDRTNTANTDFFDGSGGLLLHRLTRLDAQDMGLTSSGKYSFVLGAGHSFVTGWDGSFSRRVEDRIQRESGRLTTIHSTLDESFDGNVTRLAAFAQDEWDVTPRFAVYLGLRWEGIETRSEAAAVGSVTSRSSVWSPIVQTLWKLPGTQKDQVRAGLARTYRAPEIGSLIPRRYFAPNNTATTPDTVGNPNLKPELSTGIDVAYEHYPTAGGVFSVSAFQRRLHDIFLRELVFEDGLYISRPSNQGTATTRGIEIDLKGNLRQLIAAAPSIELRGNVSRNFSRVDFLPGPYNRLDQQTRWSGTLGFDYKHGSQLTLGSSFSFKTGGPVRSSLSQVHYTVARRELETYALWRFSPAMQLRITASNLLAQDYMSVTQFTDTTGGLLERSSANDTHRRFQLVLELKL